MDSFNKNAMTTNFVIMLIIGIIFMIVFLGVIYNFFNNYDYEQSLFECNFLFNNFDGKETYFGNGLDVPNLKFHSIIQRICPSKNVEVTQSNIKQAAQLVQDCWYKTGNGIDIMPANANDLGICIYCGRISSKKQISNFDELFSNEILKKKYSIFSDSQIINTNSDLLVKKEYLPKIIEENDSLGVFYYIYKPFVGNCDANFFSDDAGFGGCDEKFSKYVGDLGGFGSKLNKISTSDIDSLGGIFFAKMDYEKAKDVNYFLNDTLDEEDGERKIDGLKNDLDSTFKKKNFDCDYLVVPIKNFD